jgi:hypothetical protein
MHYNSFFCNLRTSKKKQGDTCGITLFDCGALEGIRTPDPQVRSLVLYPTELRVRVLWKARIVM